MQSEANGKEESKIKIPQDFRKAHPLVRQARTLLESQTPDNYHRVTPPYNQRCLNIRVSKASLRRALLVMDAIVQAVIGMGHKIGIGDKSWEGTFFTIGSEQVSISMIEKVDRKERELTKEAKDRPYIWNRWEYMPTGNLTFRIDEYAPGKVQKVWNDGSRQRLDNQLSEIVQGILKTAEALRLRTIQQEEENRRRAEEQRKQEEIERIKREDEAKKKLLEQQADAWVKSKHMHAFIEACAAELSKIGDASPASPAGKWLQWAREHADSLNPLQNVYLSRLKEHQLEFHQSSIKSSNMSLDVAAGSTLL
jgi:hypothetical protein